MSPELRLVLSAAITELERQLRAAEKKVKRASDARLALPVGATRASVTTANARHMTACEQRDRIDAALRLARELLHGTARLEVAS